MASLQKGHTFSGGETVTAEKLNDLVDSATITNIVNADIGASAAIAATKLASDSITNTQIKSDAAIAGTKIAPNFGSQNVATTGSLTAGAPSVISVNSSSDALRITQVGGGKALTVEDSTNPDATPTIIGSDGTVVIGKDSGTANWNSGSDRLQVNVATSSGQSGVGVWNWSSQGSQGAVLNLNKSVSNSIGTLGAVSGANTSIGSVNFSADDGTAFFRVAAIEGQLDAAGGAGDLPGRLRFLTAADGTTALTERLRIDSAGTLVVADGGNISAGTTTGIKIGTATSQKLGFYNAAPIVQPAAAAQAAAAAQTQDAVTDSTGGTASTTLAAITAPAANATTSLTTDMTAVRNALASIASQLAKIRTDVTNIKTLQDAQRTALVNLGLMKGAA